MFCNTFWKQTTKARNDGKLCIWKHGFTIKCFSNFPKDGNKMCCTEWGIPWKLGGDSDYLWDQLWK